MALVSGVDGLCSYKVSPPCPSPLWSYDLSIGILLRVVSFGLPCGHNVSLLVIFLRVLSIVARSALVDCLLRRHHQDTTGDVTMGASAISLRKNAYMQKKTCNYITLVRCICICKRRDVIQKLCNT